MLFSPDVYSFSSNFTSKKTFKLNSYEKNYSILIRFRASCKLRER